MSSVAGPVESTSEETPYVNREDLSHEKAAALLNDTLAQVNEQFSRDEKGYQVVYHGQPHLGTKGEKQPKTIDPTLPLDLALDYGETLEPIDIIDLVSFVGYDSSKGRLTTGFMAIRELARVIEVKVEEHLACKDNPHVLISPVSGTKYNVEKLSGHTLAIDPQNYIFLDGYRVVYFLDDEEETKPEVLSASSLRSSGVMQIGTHEFADRLYLYEGGDPAPRFCFDLSKVIQVAKEHFPADQQKDVGIKDNYYVLRRDPGKI